MQPEEKTVILTRLRSAEGHMRAVIGMVESGQNCEKILHQLHAVEAALQVTGLHLLQCQVEQSIEIVSQHPSLEKRNAEIERLIELYRFILIFA